MKLLKRTMVNMKNVFVLSLLSMFMVVSCTNGTTGGFDSNDKAEIKERKNYCGPTLYGDVKKVTSVTYSVRYNNGEYVEDERLTKQEYSFNRAGDLTEYSYKDYEDSEYSYRKTYDYDSKRNELKYRKYDSDDHIVEKYKNKYDKQGNLTEASDIDDNKTCYTYENGNLVRKDSYYSDGSKHRYSRFEYDSDGNEVEEYKYDYTDHTYTRHLKEYDSEGNIVSEAHYWCDELLFATVYSYDTDSNCIFEQHFDEYGDVDRTIVSEYHNGNLVSRIWCDGAGEITSSLVKRYNSDGKILYSELCSANESTRSDYNENEQIVKYQVFDNRGRLKEMDTYEYDASGNEIKCISMEDYGKTEYKVESEYDRHGNCVKYIYYSDSMQCPDEITKTTIHYF